MKKYVEYKGKKNSVRFTKGRSYEIIEFRDDGLCIVKDNEGELSSVNPYGKNAFFKFI